MKLFESPVVKNSPVPAHQQVRDKLLALIKSGELPPNGKLPSEPQIAEWLGVSRMTANKAILALVSEGWVSREKGRGTYVCSPPATIQRCAIAMVPTHIPGVMEDYYFGSIYWNMQALLSEHSLPIEIVRLDSTISEHIGPGTGLIAINPPQSIVPALAELRSSGVPVVLVGATWQDWDIDSVDSDNFLGPALAVNHLAELGHRRVLFVGSNPGDSNTQDRLRGFRIAMKARQLDVAPEDEFMARGYTFDDDAVETILERVRDEATAVFAAGPRLAIQMLVAAQREGLSVPQRLSIVGYDDPSYLSYTHPAMTTVKQPLADMAKVAFKLVWEGSSDARRPVKRHLLDPQLIVRGSTGPPCRG